MSGGTPCCVPGCSNNTKYHRNVSFHAFPTKNLALRKIWIKQLNRQAPTGKFQLWQPKHFHRICGAHFNASGKKGPTDKIPTIFNNKSTTTDKKRVERRLKCKTPPVDVSNEISVEDVNSGVDLESIPSWGHVFEATDSSSSSPPSQDLNRNVEPSEHWNHDHTYRLRDEPLQVIHALKIALDKARDDLHNSQLESMNAKQEAASLQIQLDACKLENLKEKKTNSDLKLQLLNIEFDRRLKKRIDKRPCLYDSCMKDEGKLKFYTGFSNKESFDDFVQLVHPKYLLARQMHTSGRVVRVLDFEDQLLLVLMKLRLDLLEKDLAYRFKVSQTTVAMIWQFWLEFLSTHSSEIPIEPIQNLVKKYNARSKKKNLIDQSNDCVQRS